jgi:hypothetical protein
MGAGCNYKEYKKADAAQIWFERHRYSFYAWQISFQQIIILAHKNQAFIKRLRRCFFNET